MAGILTAASTAAPPASSQPAKPMTPIPSVGAGQPQTAGDLLSASPQQAAANAVPPIHSNPGINEALMNAFRPVIPDQINSLLGPAIGAIQGHTLPISYVQPRPAAAIRRSS